MVVPILSYGAEIRGYELNNSIEQVHSKNCKNYLGINVSINATREMRNIPDSSFVIVLRRSCSSS